MNQSNCDTINGNIQIPISELNDCEGEVGTNDGKSYVIIKNSNPSRQDFTMRYRINLHHRNSIWVTDDVPIDMGEINVGNNVGFIFRFDRAEYFEGETMTGTLEMEVEENDNNLFQY